MAVFRRIKLLLSDRRGVAAMEFGIIATFLIALLLPISDVASASVAYMRGYQAMRNVVAFVQYNPPPDLTAPAPATNWPRLPNTMAGYAVTPKSCTSSSDPACTPPASAPGSTVDIYITVLCGDPPGGKCTAANVADATVPKWYYLTTNLSFNPLVLTGLNGAITHAERFQ
jgi:Flp pilus assembly pilin Flp